MHSFLTQTHAKIAPYIHQFDKTKENNGEEVMGGKINSLGPCRQEIIKSFMPTIRYWAKHYHFKCHHVLEVDDLMMVGVIGLIDAMNKYKEEKKNQFKTYAEFRIRGEIIDELRKQDWMSRSERSKQKKFKKAKNNLTEKLGRMPTSTELSNVLPFKSKDMIRMQQYESGDTIRPYIDGETHSHSENLDSEFEIYSLKKTLLVVMDDLSKSMRLIVTLKYFEDLSFQEISRIMGLSEGRICQIHMQAIDHLRSTIEAQKIDILAS